MPQLKAQLRVEDFENSTSGSEYVESESESESESETSEDAASENEAALPPVAQGATKKLQSVDIGIMDDLSDMDDLEGQLDNKATDYGLDDEVLYNGNLNPPEYYQRTMETLNEDDYMQKEYSKGTTVLINPAERQWRLFCRKVLRKDWMLL